MARLTWGPRLASKRVLYFIDNDSARLALIKSYSPILESLKIIEKCATWDCTHNSTAWYARVPTEANCADGPSRMEMGVVKEYGAEIIQPKFPDRRSWATDVLGFGQERIRGQGLSIRHQNKNMHVSFHWAPPYGNIHWK